MTRPERMGPRYQIKGRRVHQHATSHPISVIRNLLDNDFDMLAGVIFDDYFKVLKAAIIPKDKVEKLSSYNPYTNSYMFNLRKTVEDERIAKDVTAKVRAAMVRMR